MVWSRESGVRITPPRPDRLYDGGLLPGGSGSGNRTSGGVTFFQPITEILSVYGLSAYGLSVY
jgi:hypothetical protein